MSAQDRMRTAVVFAAPVVVLAGLAAHPFVHNYLDLDGGVSLAAAVAGAPS